MMADDTPSSEQTPDLLSRLNRTGWRFLAAGLGGFVLLCVLTQALGVERGLFGDTLLARGLAVLAVGFWGTSLVSMFLLAGIAVQRRVVAVRQRPPAAPKKVRPGYREPNDWLRQFENLMLPFFVIGAGGFCGTALVGMFFQVPGGFGAAIAVMAGIMVACWLLSAATMVLFFVVTIRRWLRRSWALL